MEKVVLVTGASGGLGQALVKNLLIEKYLVIGTGRNFNNDLKKIKEKNFESFHFYELDLDDTSLIRPFIKKITKEHGSLYGLINNAAVGLDGVLATMHESEISLSIKVNLEASIVFSKYSFRSMMLNKTGRIINISSIIGKTGFNGLSVYAATKSGLIGFNKSFSRETAKMNITSNCVLPGYMQTNMTKDIEDQKLKSILRRSPMSKLAETNKVAKVVLFLLSDDASDINGTEITVDTGSSA
jgi:3-oxoacyl-[acyl-carrier protein] reductase|tara:strand:+ start:1017 stop:1742 length:726 start_codon:yes stop_codon:yes gene_type:complete